MEHTLNHGMCRCCASEGMFKNFSATYQWMGADEVYSDMLKECFDIALTHAEDCNNGGICEVCITQLRNASNFKKQVLQTEEQFKKMVQDNLFKTNIVKVENSKDEDELESEPDNLSDPDYSGTEFEVPVKEEVIEPKTRKRAAKASTSSAKKAKTEDGEPSRTRTCVKEKGNRKLTYLTRGSVKTTRKKAAKVSVNSEVNSDSAVELKKNLKSDTVKKHYQSFREERKKFNHNVAEVLKCSNATLIRNVGRLGYACCYCDDEYPDPLDLKKHALDSHRGDNPSGYVNKRGSSLLYVKVDITRLQCMICSKNMDTLDELMCHLNEMHGKKLFMDIKDHMVPFKFDNDDITCFICLNTFHGFKLLLEHMNVHCRNFVCELCDAGFITRTGLANHAKSHEVGAFNCRFCEKVFGTHTRKKAHERYAHTVCDSLYKCGYCNETFRYYQHKNKHLLEAHGVARKVFKCNACDRTYKTSRAFRNHTKRDHLMERKHKCMLCDKKFFREHELTHHMIKHTGVRKFQCDICLKAYGRKSTLREHIRIHADDRRFQCVHCGMSFVQKCSWRSHVLTKHGEKV